jgi:hypothetical protein
VLCARWLCVTVGRAQTAAAAEPAPAHAAAAVQHAPPRVRCRPCPCCVLFSTVLPLRQALSFSGAAPGAPDTTVRVRALFAFKGQGDAQLSFAQGDTMKVVDENSPGSGW